MSYQSAKRNYEAEKFVVGPERELRCSDCQRVTNWTDLSIYGCKCHECFTAYCKNPPRHITSAEHRKDPLGWAKRIMDKLKHGEPVSIFAEKLARSALGLKHEQ